MGNLYGFIPVYRVVGVREIREDYKSRKASDDAVIVENNSFVKNKEN